MATALLVVRTVGAEQDMATVQRVAVALAVGADQDMAAVQRVAVVRH